MWCTFFITRKLSSSNNLCRIYLKIYYRPSYEREIWHYQKANIGNIRNAIDQFPWATRFTNIDVNEKVNLFNKTIKNIIPNFVTHETITSDERDPRGINKDIRELIHEKNQAYTSHCQNKNNSLFITSNFLIQS